MGRGTHHDLAAFDQRDSQVEDLQVDGSDVRSLQVPIAKFIGDTHDEVVFPGPKLARSTQDVAAGAHEVVQGSVECQVVGVP